MRSVRSSVNDTQVKQNAESMPSSFSEVVFDLCNQRIRPMYAMSDSLLAEGSNRAKQIKKGSANIILSMARIRS